MVSVAAANERTLSPASRGLCPTGAPHVGHRWGLRRYRRAARHYAGLRPTCASMLGLLWWCCDGLELSSDHRAVLLPGCSSRQATKRGVTHGVDDLAVAAASVTRFTRSSCARGRMGRAPIGSGRRPDHDREAVVVATRRPGCQSDWLSSCCQPSSRYGHTGSWTSARRPASLRGRRTPDCRIALHLSRSFLRTGTADASSSSRLSSMVSPAIRGRSLDDRPHCGSLVFRNRAGRRSSLPTRPPMGALTGSAVMLTQRTSR